MKTVSGITLLYLIAAFSSHAMAQDPNSNPTLKSLAADINWSLLITGLAGCFAFWKYIDQRKRELQSKRYDQYWSLINTSQRSTFIAEQQISLLLLKKYPEYKDETIAYLSKSLESRDTWTAQNADTIRVVLNHFQPHSKEHAAVD